MAASCPAELLELLGGGGREPRPQEGPCRLAIVDPTPQRMALARKVITRGTPWRGRNDVWFTAQPLLAGHSGLTAFLFPGFEPEPVGSVDDVADHLGVARPQLHPDNREPASIVDQAVDIVTVGRLLARALQSLGVQPALLAGHSLGEWTAMIISGMCEPEAVDAFIAPVRAGRTSLPDVAYAALGCGVDVARAVLVGLEDVHLSHDNCPHQCVICGRPDQVDRALGLLSTRGVLGQVMPFRSGFHTPALKPCIDAGREHFRALNPRRPALPVWSATDVGAYPESPGAVRDLVIRHLLEPVRFRELVEALYEEGVRAFVQVGTGSLVGFVDDTLGKRDHLAIAAQVPRRSALDQLARVLVALWVEGALPAGAAPQPAPALRPDPVPVATPAPAEPAHRPEPSVAAPNPVVAAFEAALAEATAASRAVMEAWRRASPPAARPPAGQRTFSLATMPELRDHCLFRQAPGWADDSDQFPVVPMTMLFEVMADAARAAFPGRIVVGLSRVRALRWLAVAPPVTVPTEVTVQPDGLVKVTVGAYAEGLVEMAGAYPAPPPPDRAPLRAERAPEVSARSLYEDGWMFHGPRYQGVREITAFGDDGIRGTLEALPAPGALLDAAGQLAGHWAQCSASLDRLAFPAAIDAVHFFGPHPRPGARLSCTVRVRSYTDDRLRADLDVVGEDGALWTRIEGWDCRRFATDDITWPAVITRPSEASLGEHQPGGWCLVRERWPDLASLEYTMRRYLNAAERADYHRRNPRAQRTWLLGRIAAKDAARGWLWRHGHRPLFPAEFHVHNHGTGQPWIEGPRDAERLTVSLAHTAGVGVAIVRPSSSARVGIDVESVESVRRAADALGAVAFTAAERALLDALSPGAAGPGPVLLARVWTAKEAVAKAMGTGLAGRPQAFVVTGVDRDVILVSGPSAGGGPRAYRVTTCLLPGEAGATPEHVVAWTVDPVPAAEAGLLAPPAGMLQFVPEEHTRRDA